MRTRGGSARVILWAGLLVFGLGGQPPAETMQEIILDASAPSRPFPHYWEQVFGSGRATLSLRESYRRDLRAMRTATDIHYVRFHAIFDDDVGVYTEDAHGQPVYNWSYVDQIYDGLLEGGVRPFVELSFMPRALAASLQPHAFWYKPFPSPPKSYATVGGAGVPVRCAFAGALRRARSGTVVFRSLERAEYRLLDRPAQAGDLL